MINQFADQAFWSAGSCRYPQRADTIEPVQVEIGCPLDQHGSCAFALRHLDEPDRIGGIGRAEYEYGIRLCGQGFYRGLPVGSRITDVLAPRRRDVRKTLAQGVDHLRRVIDRQGGLRQEGERIGVGWAYPRHVFHRLDQRDSALRNLSQGSDHFGVAAMADEQDMPSVLDQSLGLTMHLRHERAGRIDIIEPAILGVTHHDFRHAMRGEDDGAPVGHLLEFLHEDGALSAQGIDHEAIMDDLMPDIDRSAIFLERQLHDPDRAVDTRAKAARGRYQQGHRRKIRGLVRLGRRGGLSVVHRKALTRLLASTIVGSYEPLPALGRMKADFLVKRKNRVTLSPSTLARSIKARSALALTAATLVVGCAGKGELDETLGLKVTRSVCPAVAIPDYTGDVSLFSPAESHDSRALDVIATITNLQTACDQTATPVKANVTFDVVARRASPSGARDITLPYFATVMRGGSGIVSKQIGNVLVHFDDGQVLGKGRAAAGAEVDKAAASLPDNISAQLNRKRKATDADASVDPMSDPRTRAAVSKASFELLIGFQLTQSQLAYNATR